MDLQAQVYPLNPPTTIPDPSGATFEVVLRQELKKISAFYVEKEEELQAIMQGLANRNTNCLASFRQEVQDLKKYVVLNYVAVIKAIKKRNRHLKVGVGGKVVFVKQTRITNLLFSIIISISLSSSTPSSHLHHHHPPIIRRRVPQAL